MWGVYEEKVSKGSGDGSDRFDFILQDTNRHVHHITTKVDIEKKTQIIFSVN